MAKGKKSDKKPIEFYDHKGKKRVNNPPVGLVTPETDRESGKKQYAYDPHKDPSLQWAVSKSPPDVKVILEETVNIQ
jgi:adenine-specific DNA-methyltransferase